MTKQAKYVILCLINIFRVFYINLLERNPRMDDIIDLLFSERVASITAIVLTAILSYYFTTKAENKKHNVEIYMLQMKKVFLPLHLLVYDKTLEIIDFQNLYNNMNLKRKKYPLYLPVYKASNSDTFRSSLRNFHMEP